MPSLRARYACVRAGLYRVHALARVPRGLCPCQAYGFAPFWCGWIKRPTARFWARAMRWHRRGLFLALLAHFGALLGLCWRRAMLARARAGLQCLFSCISAQCWMAIQYIGYGLAYGLAYGIAWAWPALSVWLRLAGACLLSIHRIMKPGLLVR